MSEEGARAAMAELSKDYVAHSTTKNVRKKEFFVKTPLELKGGIKTADLVRTFKFVTRSLTQADGHED